MEEISKYLEVITESIHSIICIDDHYVDAYDDIESIQKSEKDYRETQEMYRALSANAGCQASLVRFDESKDISTLLRNQDLLILDWRLDDHADRPEKTLGILKEAVLADIPYVCIYTKDSITDIFPICAYFFSGVTHEELQRMSEAVEMLSKDMVDLLKNNSFYQPSEIPDVLREQLTSAFEELEIDCSEKRELYKAYLTQKVNKVGGEYLLSGSTTHICDNYSVERNVLCVKDTIILFMQKDKITAEHVLNKIVEAVKEVVENTVVNIIWLNYSNQFKKALRRRNSFLQGVKPEAFAYCVKKLSNNESDLETFVRELYRQELDDLVMAYDVDVPAELKEALFNKLANVERDNLHDQLATINSRIMINHVLSKIGHKLQLGDMFCSDDETFWLCVTALCDCARPEEKIDNDYLFIQGKLVLKKKESAIKRAESRWDSYVEIDNRKMIIEWARKIKSIYVEKGLIEKQCSIDGQFRNQQIKLKYIGTLKEKYVQRIVNEVFSQAERVGVSLANTRKLKCAVTNIEGKSITVEFESGKSDIIQILDDKQLKTISKNKEIFWDPCGYTVNE